MKKRLISFVLIAGLLLSISILPIFQTTASAGLAPAGGKFLGNILKYAIETDADYDTYWNQVTPEVSGKWYFVESSRDVYDWSKLDDDYNYAINNGMPFKEHALVWGNLSYWQSWLNGLSEADIRAETEEWISDYFERYPNTAYCDVVNEPIYAPPPQAFRNALGGDTNWAWVKWIYEKAALYKPANCKLLINEFNILTSSSKRSTYKQICQMLINEGLLDGIGEQGHFLESTSASTITSALNDLATLGLPIYISEYEVDIADDTTQRDTWASQFPAMWTHSAVEGFTLWGYKQGQMWKPNGYLFKTDGTERLALQWLRSYFNSTPLPTSTPTPTPALDTLVDQNFNSGTTGSAPSGWTVGDASLVTVQNVPSSSDKSMQINNTTGYSGNLTATKTFTSQTSGVVIQTLKFMMSQLTTNVTLGYLQDSSGTNATSVYYDSATQKIRYVTSGGSYHDLPGGTGLSANTWYDVKVVVNMNNDTHDIYFQDMNTPKVTGATFRNSVSSISQIQFQVNDNASNVSAYYDNVKILGDSGGATPTPTPTPTPLVNEHFNSGTTGSAPSGWTVGDASLVTVQEVPSASDKSMYINNTTGYSGNLAATKTFASQTSGVLTQTLKFRMSQLTANVSFGYLQDSSGTNATSVYYDSATQKIRYVTSGNTYHDLPGGTGLSANTWYDVKVVASLDNDTYDIYFQDMDTAKVTGATFRNSVSSISQIQFQVNDNASNVSAYFNDIKITK